MKPLGLLLLMGGIYAILTALAYVSNIDPTTATLATVFYAGLMLLAQAILAILLILFIADILAFAAQIASQKSGKRL